MFKEISTTKVVILFSALIRRLPVKMRKKLIGHCDDIKEDLLQQCFEASLAGNWPRVRHILQSPQFMLASRPMKQQVVNEMLKESCRHGHLETVKFLLQSQQARHGVFPTPFLMQREYDPDSALLQAGGHGHLAVMRYLLKEFYIDPPLHGIPWLRWQIEIEECLLLAWRKNIHEVVHFLVFDYNIVLSHYLEQMVQNYPDLHALFEKRLLNAKLKQELALPAHKRTRSKV